MTLCSSSLQLPSVIVRTKQNWFNYFHKIIRDKHLFMMKVFHSNVVDGHNVFYSWVKILINLIQHNCLCVYGLQDIVRRFGWTRKCLFFLIPEKYRLLWSVLIKAGWIMWSSTLNNKYHSCSFSWTFETLSLFLGVWTGARVSDLFSDNQNGSWVRLSVFVTSSSPGRNSFNNLEEGTTAG